MFAMQQELSAPEAAFVATELGALFPGIQDYYRVLHPERLTSGVKVGWYYFEQMYREYWRLAGCAAPKDNLSGLSAEKAEQLLPLCRAEAAKFILWGAMLACRSVRSRSTRLSSGYARLRRICQDAQQEYEKAKCHTDLSVTPVAVRDAARSLSDTSVGIYAT